MNLSHVFNLCCIQSTLSDMNCRYHFQTILLRIVGLHLLMDT